MFAKVVPVQRGQVKHLLIRDGTPKASGRGGWKRTLRKKMGVQLGVHFLDKLLNLDLATKVDHVSFKVKAARRFCVHCGFHPHLRLYCQHKERK